MKGPAPFWPTKLRAMPARDQRALIAAAVGVSALLLLAVLAGHPQLLAFSAPLFLVAVPLVAGRYVGEATLERLRRGTGRRSRPRPAVARATGPRRTPVLLPRGGRLIAEALAVRPPPPALS